jgi:NADH-quinone oxidoreductase subunit N
MEAFLNKLATLWPELIMLIGATLCLLLGLSNRPSVRVNAWTVALGTLLATGLLVVSNRLEPDPQGNALADYIKIVTVVLGVLLLMVSQGVPESQATVSRGGGGRGAPIAESGLSGVAVGEFYAFVLLSLTGVMLCSGASDLVWLFLALELTSLPTYVLVSTARRNEQAQEAGIKYFFLGAFSAAVFLYGFAMIYGATGYTDFGMIHAYVQNQVAAGQGVPSLMILGVILAVLGIGFKIAAVPMHFYAADVYQGADVSITAFLAFVPKTAGLVAMMLILGLVGWPLPAPVMATLWLMAVATMILGNVMGLLQENVKRVLAYSSIAHSGYMLVGLIAGYATASQSQQAGPNGIAAVLFYIVAYGLATVGSFAVLGSLRQKHTRDEAQGFDALAGLVGRDATLAGVMLVSLLSLIGVPPMVGLLSKIFLFGPALDAGFVSLVVIAAINSAVSAVYYLRIVRACFFDAAQPQFRLLLGDRGKTRKVAAILAGGGVLLLGILGSMLTGPATQAGRVVHAQPPAPTLSLHNRPDLESEEAQTPTGPKGQAPAPQTPGPR